MDQGFWLFFIFQLVALGALADRMNLVGLRKTALVAGLVASMSAALFALLLSYGGINGDLARSLLKWMMLGTMMSSLMATAASVSLPAELSKKRA